MDVKRLKSQKYLQLRSEDAGLLDLLRVLYSRDVETNQFIALLKVKETILKRRGIIFSSLLAQKALRFIARPLQIFGSCFEMWLNLLAHHRICDKDEASFVSTIGHLDRRVELDNNIEPGDSRYLGALCAMASKIAYENEALIKATVEGRWKMELLGAYDFWNEYQQRKTTQGFIFRDKFVTPEAIIVAFRGSEPFDADAWSTDCDISWYKFHKMGRVRSGFLKALGLQKDQTLPLKIQENSQRPFAYYAIRELLREVLLENDQTRVVLAGHSLGGALAVLFAAVLAFHGESFILERVEGIYTFGQPKVGDDKFGEFMKSELREYGVRYYRYVYSHDIVPRLPWDNSALMFRHFGTCVYYNTLYEEKIMPDEPCESYYSIWSCVAQRVDALWELVRSFLLPYICGPTYKEGLLLKALRVLGLFSPGISAHAPHEYINATRLGSADLFY